MRTLSPRGGHSGAIHTAVHPIFWVKIFSLSLILLSQEKIFSKSDNFALKLTKRSTAKTSEILSKSGAIRKEFIALFSIFFGLSAETWWYI